MELVSLWNERFFWYIENGNIVDLVHFIFFSVGIRKLEHVLRKVWENRVDVVRCVLFILFNSLAHLAHD